MRTKTERSGSAVVTLPSDTEIRIVRQFDASADLLFEVWTTPEHVRNWWGFPEHEMVSCQIDLRVGGDWRYVVSHPDMGEIGWHGTYLEIEAPNLIVSTEVFEGYPDAHSVNRMMLTESDGVTTMDVLVTHQSKENRDGHVNAGMEGGMQVSLDRVDEILAGLQGGDDGD
jgi:uncharacterized protein YndB with AHSA1/START domain